MELIQIGENKLKVMLSEEDMKRYSIAFEYLDYTSRDTRNAIWSILDEAKERIGFDISRENIYIQIFGKNKGGCELFVTCGSAEKKKNFAVFKFETISVLVSACHAVSDRLVGESIAYYGDDGECYLAVNNEKGRKELSALSVLTEFGISVPWRPEYMAEHAKIICENALCTLAEL